MSQKPDSERTVEVVRKRVKREVTETYEEIIIRRFKDPNIKTLFFDPFESIAKVSIGECNEASAIDDLEIRKELTTIVGLPHVPNKSDSAFADLLGILDDIVTADEIDTVRWVKSVRRTK